MLRRRHPTRSALVAVVAVLVASATLAGCSKGKDDAAPTTTASTARPTSTVPTTVAPPPTLDDGGYTKFVNSISSKLDSAGTNPCRVSVVFRDIGQGPQPRTVAQGRQAVDLVVRLFESIAGAAGPANAADAKVLVAGGARVAAQAKANGYRPDWIAKNANEAVGADGIAALQRLVTANSDRCRENGGAPATAGG